MINKRTGRLNSEFQKYIYEILKDKVKDPELTEMFSISEVNCTADLKHAKVFLSVFSNNEEKKEKTFNAIKNASPFIRKEISKIMHIRTVPEFHFFIDTSEEYANNIEKILKEINNGEKND